MVTIGSLFSGIGGLELGLEIAMPGALVRWQCDSDPTARRVLAERWPGVRIYEDVREIDERAERVDIICGGFPCQPVSFAGRRQAQGDARWLWPFFAAVLERVRPGLVFIENVVGLRTAGLRDVLADLAALGFDAEWACFRACEAGAPHPRARLFILAYTDRQLGKARDRVLAEHDREAAVPGGRHPALRDHDWSDAAAGVRGVADGLPGRVDRVRLAGNAVVPQQAALAFRALMDRARSA